MTKTLLHRWSCAALVLLALGVNGAAAAYPAAGGPYPRAAALGEVLVAQGGCSAAAQQAAAQSGGQVLSVQTADRGGQTVCIVTVLVPAQDGNRPRRQTITIPQ